MKGKGRPWGSEGQIREAMRSPLGGGNCISLRQLLFHFCPMCHNIQFNADTNDRGSVQILYIRGLLPETAPL